MTFLRRSRVGLAVVALAAAGAAVAALVTAETANAWSITSLPAGYNFTAVHVSEECDHVVLTGNTTGTTFDWDTCTPGYTAALSAFTAANPDGWSQVTNAVITPSCWTYQLTGFGATSAVMNDCDPTFQQQLDAFISSTCPCAQTTSTTTSTPATTAAGTTTTPTTTSSSGGDPDVTTTQTTTPPTTTTPTATTTGPTTDELQQELKDLEAQITALNGRVTALEAAVVDAWGAYEGALATGATTAEAALIAHSVAMNDLHGLSS